MMLVTVLLLFISSQAKPVLEGKTLTENTVQCDFDIDSSLLNSTRQIFCLDKTDIKWDHPFIRVSYNDLYPSSFSLQSPQYLVAVPLSVREMENF